MAAYNDRKTSFGKKRLVDSGDTLWVKNFIEIALSYIVSEINAFLHLHRNQRWPPKKAGKRFWGKGARDHADTLWFQNFVEITLPRTVYKINAFLHFTQKFKMATKNLWQENYFWENLPVHSADNLWVKNFVEIAL